MNWLKDTTIRNVAIVVGAVAFIGSVAYLNPDLLGIDRREPVVTTVEHRTPRERAVDFLHGAENGHVHAGNSAAVAAVTRAFVETNCDHLSTPSPTSG